MKHLLALLLLFLPGTLSAQTSLRLQNEQVRSVQEIWSIAVQQLNTSEQEVYVQGSIREKNAGEIYRARGTSFTLTPGTQVLTEQAAQPLEVLLNRLPNSDVLPNGQYWIQLSLMETNSNRELASLLSKVEVTGSEVLPTWKAATEASTKAVRSSGHIRTVYNMNLPGVATISGRTALPKHFVRTDVQAQATVFRVPLEITGLYSTENGTGIGPANQLGFSLDKEAIKSAALQWLEERLSPKILFDSAEAGRADYYRTALRDKRYPQYQSWREQCDTLHLDEQLRSSQQLTNINAALDNSALKGQMNELKTLKSQYQINNTDELYGKAGTLPDSVYQRLGNLFRLEQSYQRLEQQRDELTQQKEKYQKYERMYRKVKAIERQNTIRDLARDNDDIRAGMRTFGRINRLQNFLLGLDELDIGSSYPYFSPLTLSGVRIHGVNFAYTSVRKWHIGINFGKKQGSTEPDTLLISSSNTSYYAQYMGGIQVGIGRPGGNFCYLQHLRTADYGHAPTTVVEQESSMPKPYIENFVTGLAFRYQDPKRIVLLSGEINQSLLNPDQDAPPHHSEQPLNLSRLLGGVAKTGSAVDWSYQGNAKVNLPNGTTRLSALIHHLGKGYRTLGAPFLLTDITRYEIKGNQELLRNKIQVGAYLRRDFDQTAPLSKINRMFTTNYGTQLRYSPSKSLTLIADYSPYAQQRDGTDTSIPIERKGQIWMTSVQYRKKAGSGYWNSQTTWISQQLSSQDSSIRYQINSLQVNNQWQQAKYLFALSGQYAPKVVQERHTTLSAIDGSVTLMQLFKKASLTFGGQHATEPGITTLSGLYCRSSIKISKNINLDLNFRHAIIQRPLQNQRYVQEYGWLALGVRW